MPEPDTTRKLEDDITLLSRPGAPDAKAIVGEYERQENLTMGLFWKLTSEAVVRRDEQGDVTLPDLTTAIDFIRKGREVGIVPKTTDAMIENMTNHLLNQSSVAMGLIATVPEESKPALRASIERFQKQYATLLSLHTQKK